MGKNSAAIRQSLKDNANVRQPLSAKCESFVCVFLVGRRTSKSLFLIFWLYGSFALLSPLPCDNLCQALSPLRRLWSKPRRKTRSSSLRKPTPPNGRSVRDGALTSEELSPHDLVKLSFLVRPSQQQERSIVLHSRISPPLAPTCWQTLSIGDPNNRSLTRLQVRSVFRLHVSQVAPEIGVRPLPLLVWLCGG